MTIDSATHNLVLLLWPFVLSILAYWAKEYAHRRFNANAYINFSWTVDKVVQGVEQAMGEATGEERYETAFETLAEIAQHNGVPVTEQQIQFLIESAVKEMNDTASYHKQAIGFTPNSSSSGA